MTDKEFVFTRKETIELEYSSSLSEEDWEDFIDWASYTSDTAEVLLRGLVFEQIFKYYKTISWAKQDGTIISLEEAITEYLRDIAQQGKETETGFDFKESLIIK